MPSPPAIAIPQGCEHDMSGTYQLHSHPGFRYRATDDGSALNLSVERGPSGCASIALWRTAHGFVGKTFGGYLSDAGTACAVTFPTEVTACTDAGLVLRSAAKAAVTPQCAALDLPQPAALVERILLRTADFPLPDAGVDAGSPGAASGDSEAADGGLPDGGLSRPPPPV